MKIYPITDLGQDWPRNISDKLIDIANTKNKFTTIGHNPSLPAIIDKTFHFTGNIMIVEEKDEIVGYIPYSMIGNKFVSLPHFSYGGFCGPQGYQSKVYSELLSILTTKKYSYEIRDFEKFSPHTNIDKVTTILDIENTADKQMSVFKSKLRSQIRKGMKNGLSAHVGTIELLKDFYDVYTMNMHRLGSPVLPLRFFENILKYYKYGLARIFIIKNQDKVIGAAIALSFSRFMEVCWASTIQEYNHLSTNMCLYWELIRFAIENDMSTFSFGRSSKESSTLKFKHQWGGQDLQLYWNYDLPMNINVRKLKIASTIWKKLPASVVNRLGPIISSRIY